MYSSFRDFREAENKRRWRIRWSASFDADSRDFDAVHNARLKTAWRIVRTHAICKGQISPEERLGMLPEELWYAPMPDSSSKNRTTTALQICDDFCGLGLLPTEYQEAKYTAAFFRVARILEIPDYDLIGFDEYIYPSREDIIRFEYQFVQDYCKDFLYAGNSRTFNRLIAQDNLTELETIGLLELIKAEISRGINFDTERDRRMMVARLEDYLRRAQDSADLRAEMQGLKALSVVQGINKAEPEDTITLVATIARDLAKEERKQLNGPETD